MSIKFGNWLKLSFRQSWRWEEINLNKRIWVKRKEINWITMDLSILTFQITMSQTHFIVSNALDLTWVNSVKIRAGEAWNKREKMKVRSMKEILNCLMLRQLGLLEWQANKEDSIDSRSPTKEWKTSRCSSVKIKNKFRNQKILMTF